MQKQETVLRVELGAGITTEIGLSVVQRLGCIVVGHDLNAEPVWGSPSFDIDLQVDRPLDELVAIARANIPANISARFSIWRWTEDADGCIDAGEEAAQLYADPLPGLAPRWNVPATARRSE